MLHYISNSPTVMLAVCDVYFSVCLLEKRDKEKLQMPFLKSFVTTVFEEDICGLQLLQATRIHSGTYGGYVLAPKHAFSAWDSCFYSDFLISLHWTHKQLLLNWSFLPALSFQALFTYWTRKEYDPLTPAMVLFLVSLYPHYIAVNTM